MYTRHTTIPASYLILKQENKILLIRRFNTGYEDGNYSMISGHLEPGEKFSEAIVREAQEEAGITIDPKNLKIVHIMHRKKQNGVEIMDVFFMAEKWSGVLENKEPHKCDDFAWFDIDHLPENLIHCLKIMLEDVKKNIFFSEYGWN